MHRPVAYLLVLAGVGLFLLFTVDFWSSLYFPFFSLLGGAIDSNLNVLGLILLMGLGFYLLDTRVFRI